MIVSVPTGKDVLSDLLDEVGGAAVKFQSLPVRMSFRTKVYEEDETNGSVSVPTGKDVLSDIMAVPNSVTSLFQSLPVRMSFRT